MQSTEIHPETEQQTVPNLANINLEQLIGYDLIDRNNQEIGKVSAFWTDHTGRPAFIGVKTFWLMGKAHVIPAYGAEVNHARKHVRLPFTNEEVKGAPNYDPDAELAPEQEREVIGYYQGKGQGMPRQPENQPAEYQAKSTGSREELSAGMSPKGETRIPLHEEELAVGKRSVEMGGVRLRKIVRTETVQQPVEIKREDVVVERVPASGQSTEGKAFEEEEIYIPLWREEPVVSKQAHVHEEVRAWKTEESEPQNVSGEVRKEEIEVEDQRKEGGSK